MESICVFGDSLAKGIGYDAERDRYYPMKTSFVTVATRQLRLACTNLSKFGSTITRGADMLAHHMEDAQAADIVVIEFGGNDSDFEWKEIAADPDARHDPKTSLDVFRSTLTGMVGTIRNLGKTPLLCNLPPIEPKRYFEHISRGLNADHIREWLGGSAEYIYNFHEMYSIAVDRVAAALQAPMLDLRSVFLSDRRYPDLLCADGIHPNEAGHQRIGDAIRDAALASPIYTASLA